MLCGTKAPTKNEKEKVYDIYLLFSFIKNQPDFLRYGHQVADKNRDFLLKYFFMLKTIKAIENSKYVIMYSL